MTAQLRFGRVTEIYCRAAGIESQRQLDLLGTWFNDLLIKEEESDGLTKKLPYFSESDALIHAVRYKGRLYAGADEIIAQLCGRLTGTAAGNREKQRKNAVIMQKHVTRVLCEDYYRLEQFLFNIADQLSLLDEEQLQNFYENLLDFIIDLAYARNDMSPQQRDGEPFPMDDEIFDAVIYNAAYQLNLADAAGIVQGFAWVLLGSLLRNETGRITRRFDSSFNEVNRMPSQEPTLLSKLDYLFFPQDYEYVYEGDDFESRFPDIEWHCDQCGDILNSQEGFNDRYEAWQCRRCGKINPLGAAYIFENNEDADHNRQPADEEKMKAAVESRKEEIFL